MSAAATRRAQGVLAVVALAAAAVAARAEKPWALENPEATSWRDDVVRGVFFGSVTAAVLAVVLAAVAGWWAKPLAAPAPAAKPPAPRWFWPAVLLAVVLAGGLRWNLAHRSLWWDEVWQLKNASHGQWRPDPGGDPPVRFSDTDWARCAWYYQKPTNHAPAALAAKASLGAWRALTGAPREAFDNFAVRVPTFLVSLVAVAAIAVLVREWTHHAAAGVTAALLLAIHPWHVRYGIDTRAYSYLVLAVVLGALALTRIARGGGWGAWLGFGLVQFILVWSLPNAVWYAAGFFAAGVAVAWRTWPAGPDRRTALARVVAVNVMAAGLFALAAGPNVVQAARWIGTLYEPHYIDRFLLLDTAVQLATGTPFRVLADSDADRELASLATHPQVFAAALVFGAAALAGLAAVALRPSYRPAGVTCACLLAAAAVYLAATSNLDHHFYPRYLIYLLPLGVALAATGLHAARRLGAVPAAIAIAVLAIGFTPQLRVLATRPYAPLDEVGTFLTEATKSSPTTTYAYQLGAKVLNAYHPPLVPLVGPVEQSYDDLASAIHDAHTNGQRLLVAYGYSAFNRSIAPGGFTLLDNPSLFRQVAEFHGIEPEFTFRILEATGATPPESTASENQGRNEEEDEGDPGVESP